MGDRISAMTPEQPDNCGYSRNHYLRLRMYAERAFLESVGQRDNVYAAISAKYIQLGAMVRDPKARFEIAQEWAAVRKLCAGSHRRSQIPGGPFINETPPESFYNLPFLLAYAVLDQVLAVLIDHGTIQCQKKRPLLGDKMAASSNAIPWQDYALVDSGKTARNELTHDARLLGKADCFRFIDAIENELKAWRVL